MELIKHYSQGSCGEIEIIRIITSARLFIIQIMQNISCFSEKPSPPRTHRFVKLMTVVNSILRKQNLTSANVFSTLLLNIESIK